MVLDQFFGHILGKRHGAKRAMLELEISLRAKDPVTPLEDTELYSTTMKATSAYFFTFVGTGSLVWFATRKAPKFLGIPPLHGPLAFFYSSCCARILGDMKYYESYHESATEVLEGGEELKKMELAKIILNKHSTDELLVGVVKRYFIAENLLSDQHQEQRLFRWRQRNSYVDYSFKERMNEYEANNSADDEAESTVNSRVCEEEDALACVLGLPRQQYRDDHTGGRILKRRQVTGDIGVASMLTKLLCYDGSLSGCVEGNKRWTCYVSPKLELESKFKTTPLLGK